MIMNMNMTMAISQSKRRSHHLPLKRSAASPVNSSLQSLYVRIEHSTFLTQVSFFVFAVL